MSCKWIWVGAFLLLFVAACASAATADATDVHQPREVRLGEGTWSYRVLRFEGSSVRAPRGSSAPYGLEIRNNTKQPLVCSGVLHFSSPTGQLSVAETANVIAIMPGASLPLVVNTQSEPGQVVFGTANCDPIAIPSLALNGKHCELEASRRQSVKFQPAEYPYSELRLSASDVVTVQFVMPMLDPLAPDKHRVPSDARIIDSRGIKALDNASLALLAQMRFDTNCPGAAHRIRFEFRGTACRSCRSTAPQVTATINEAGPIERLP